MQIVHVNDRPLEHRPGKARNGSWKRREILRGDPASQGDFALTMLYEDGSKSTPRHRHNFDQIRYQVEGEVDFGPNGTMHAGVFGYFPEGAYYGPTSAPQPNMSVALQFGGASGSGYLTSEAHEVAHKALKQFGTFENGIYHRNPGVEGKKQQDGFEAAWEYAKQRSILYPEPQYANPILIETNAFPWHSVGQGVAERALGIFTSCKIRAAAYKLREGASFVASGRGIFLVLSGSANIDGNLVGKLDTVYLEDGEQSVFEAKEGTEILLMGLPSMALIGHQSSEQLQHAAE